MEILILQGLGAGGDVRFNLNHLVGYNEQELWLLGERLEITPGTASALDQLLKERAGVAFLRVGAQENSVETSDNEHR